MICLTEGHEDLLPRGGHIACGEAPGEVLAIPDARRVLLWSKETLHDIDPVGDPRLPHQAFVAGRTETPVGEIDAMCVCIPWADAGVRRFGGTRARWEEHREYLEVLGQLLDCRDQPRPLVIAGDFNQYVPRIWGPKSLSELLLKALTGLEIATRGEIPGLREPVIDHLAHSREFHAVSLRGWPGRAGDGKPLSDHSGVCVDLVRAKEANPLRRPR